MNQHIQMKLTLIFWCMLVSLGGIAQKGKVVIKLSPLSAIDVVSFPTIQGGIEFGLSKKISWHNEFGIKYAKGDGEKTDTSFIHSKGAKAKTELRYYFRRGIDGQTTKPLEGFYLAANGFYIFDQHNAEARYFLQKDSTTMHVDNFTVKKTIWGANFLLGVQQPIGKNFLIDAYAGVGARYRNITSTHKEYNNKTDELSQAIDVTITGFKYKAESDGGKSLLPNLSFGIRLCLRL